ncbi:MAG: hypothetical protein VB120_04385 [Lachnospiraceae bacterium]|nr:hypothetical protein [Lachnospiraceae bacterium]
MKKFISLLIALMFVFAMTGCAKTEILESESESLAGYIVIEDNTLYLDEVEIVTTEDTDRITELGLTIENDLPSGYYILNPIIETVSFELTDDTIYTFTDSNLLFVEDADSNRLYTTTKKKDFLKHLDASYSDDLPAQKVPFFVEVSDGKIVSVTEEFQFTI